SRARRTIIVRRRAVCGAVDERPTSGCLRRSEGREPAEPRSGGRLCRTSPAERPKRRERVVRHFAGPDEIPERVEDLAIGATPGREIQLPVERCPTTSKMLADRVVSPSLGSRGLVADARGRAAKDLPARPVERDSTVVPAKASPTDPGDLPERTELIEK